MYFRCGRLSLSVVEISRLLDGKQVEVNDWMGTTPLKINGWNLIPWRFGSDQFPFYLGDFLVPC